MPYHLQSSQLGLKQCLLKRIDYLRNCRLDSHKNALKRRKVQNCNKR